MNSLFKFSNLNDAQWAFIAMIVVLVLFEIGLSYYLDKKDNQ